MHFRINRNIVECKVKTGPTDAATAASINRNIVECKVCSNGVCYFEPEGINRNIVECKAYRLYIRQRSGIPY